jgi:hypothetical protein
MSLHDRPTLAELLEAVRGYLTEEVAATRDRRARFRALIAANVLAIAGRELKSAAGHERAELELLAELGFTEESADERRATLARRIREGAYDGPEEWQRAADYARATVSMKLAVANPRFLERTNAQH